MSVASQAQRVLAVLADGKPHTVPEIHRRAGTMRLNSRVADLRKQGHTIVCERIPHAQGARAYRYTWLDAPPQTAPQEPAQLRLETDLIAPRTPEERYRIFRVKNGGSPEIVATVATREALGVALCTLGEEGEFDNYCVGIQDALARWDAKTQKHVGSWIVKPWQAYS